MDVIPAIDFKEGKVVNLRQGKLDQTTTYSEDPMGMTDYWVAQGADRIHFVDLDGAFNGILFNHSIISSIARSCLLYTSPSPRDATLSRMPSSA